MATTHDQVTAVSDELVREHASDWHAFTKFLTYGIVGVTGLLVLMAIFLL